MTDSKIPEGFFADGPSPYSNHIGPFYYKRLLDEDGEIKKGWVGILLNEVHIGGNNRGHGGLLLTILDEAMGMNAAFHRNRTPVVTVSMQTNFMGPTIPGQFLMATAEVTHATKTMAFVEGKAWCDNEIVGSASGVWKYLSKAPQMPQLKTVETASK